MRFFEFSLAKNSDSLVSDGEVFSEHFTARLLRSSERGDDDASVHQMSRLCRWMPVSDSGVHERCV